MHIEKLDHLVITTKDLNACLHFYVNVLGMRHDESNGRHALYFGTEKFNIHTRRAEFLPAAAHPEYGSLDLCLEVQEPIETIQREIEEKGYPMELGVVERNGARGKMHSLYLRDPDGNLVELCTYVR